LADLEQLVKAVPNGFVVIDEYYFEYFGITGLTLLEHHDNLCVLRSFAAGFGIGSSDSGFLAGSVELIQRMRARTAEHSITTTIYRTAVMCLENDSALDARMKTLHDEAMRVSTELTRLGLQNRITAADFLLLRVKEPTVIGNHLARFKVPCENLDGYPLLKGYLRYHVQSPLSNDRLIDAITRIPAEQYRVSTIERRITTLHHAAEVAPTELTPVIVRRPISVAKSGRKPGKTATTRARAVRR
jgi:histidinol-phosphate aminotransferase